MNLKKTKNKYLSNNKYTKYDKITIPIIVQPNKNYPNKSKQ